MMTTENDDYWDESKISKFNFEVDDNVEGSWLFEDEAVVETIKTSSIDNSLFSHSLNQPVEIETVRKYLPEHCINCLLQDSSNSQDEIIEFAETANINELRRQIKNRWSAPPVAETIRRIFLGKNYSMELYRSFNDKKSLLEEAIKLGDGNAILVVLLYLSNTLKTSLFRRMLQTYPTAVSQYVHYLYTSRRMNELNETLESLGRSKDAMMKQLAEACENKHRLQQKINTILKNHILEPWETKTLNNYYHLLEWQMSASKKVHSDECLGSSPIEFIKYLAQQKVPFDMPESSTTKSVTEYISQTLGLSEKQILVVRVFINTESKNWNAVENLLVTKNWLGNTTLNTTLPIITLLEELHRNGAPSSLIDFILMCVKDTGERITWAGKLERYAIIIDTYKQKKDKSSLLRYVSALEPLSAERIYAEKILNEW